jgi:CelD/BcsL family acetyltransferase involved in cellulose biosynthesis
MKKSKIVLTVLFVISIFSNAHSQKITELNSYLQNQNTSLSQRLNELCFAVHPTIYMERGAVKETGTNNHVYLKTDVHSLSQLSSTLDKYSEVEVLEVRIQNSSDLSLFNLNQQTLNKAGKLKFLLVRSEFPVSETEFKNLLKSIKNTQLTLLYEVSIPH